MANGVLKFSMSTDGQPILLAGGGESIHITPATTQTTDRIYAWICNSTGVEVRVTLNHGDVNPDTIILHNSVVPANARLVYVVQGIILNNGLELRADANLGSVITISGFVVRIT